MTTINFQLLHPDAKLPSKAHASDACFDVVAVSRSFEDGYVQYGLGFATEIPDGWQGLIYPRSSVSNTDLSLCNSVAVIDASYRGEWKLRFAATNRLMDFPRVKSDRADNPQLYEVGDRIGQIQFQRVPEVRLVQVDALPPSPRGSGGFGSTGQ